MHRKATLSLLICALFVCNIGYANNNPDFRYLEPDGMALPQGSFGLGIVIEPNHRLAFLTGQTGSNADGSYSSDFETQARNALASVGQLVGCRENQCLFDGCGRHPGLGTGT
jgi:hypothetical protein